jgi:SAM-dependent methyltransferase
MNFYRRSELTPEADAVLGRYDRDVRSLVGKDYPHPLRMRDWELFRVLTAFESVPRGSRVLDTGSYNTYLALALAGRGFRATASDLVWQRMLKSFARTLGLAPAKDTEARFLAWLSVHRKAGVPVRNLNLLDLRCPEASFDRVVALSVIEHVPDVARCLSEMYRALTPGGRMIVTTDCAPEPVPYSEGTRCFSESEMEELFAPYRVVSARNRPDFSRENWCYGLSRPVVTAFVEVEKPA